MSIQEKFAQAYMGKDCHQSTCRSQNGFESVLLEGEGKIQIQSEYGNSEHEVGEAATPMIRVLLDNPAAFWVALCFSSVKNARIVTMLQGSQCIHCCITQRIQYPGRRDFLGFRQAL